MKALLFLVVASLPFTCRTAGVPSDVDLIIPHRTEALANSLRCLETIRGDDYRTALTRIWVSENLAYLGDVNTAVRVLKTSAPHYVIPYGCVESALTLLGHGQNRAVRQLLELAIELLPFTAGRGGEEVQFQVVKMATVLEEPEMVARAWAKLPASQANQQPALEAFRQDWQPSFWNGLLDRLLPDRHWGDLEKEATRDEQIAWNRERVMDTFTALLFIKEAEARVRRGERYPAHWIEFARTGVRATTPNTRPVAIQAELSALATLEGRQAEALALANSALGMMQGWAPQMTGLYPVLRDLAVRLGPSLQEGAEKQRFMDRVAERQGLLRQQLDKYEQMLQLPLLAEAFQALGEPEKAQAAWRAAAELCAQNQNPESQSIGLTRIWMSYARANTWPTKETEADLLKTEKRLPEEYAKVNF
jgi:hypothetical protein